MQLSEYQSNIQALLNDPLAQFYTTTNLTNWINRARTETAKKTRCIRLVTPSSGRVTGVSVGSAGSGYTSATVTISAPDAIGGVFTQATATATVSGGQVTGIVVTNPGTGYVTVPTVTIAGNGTGATASATLSSHLTTTLNQEVYPFTAAAAVLLATYPGVAGVIGVEDIAVSWQAMKPILQWAPWSSFQAYARAMNQGSTWPSLWAQLGVGEGAQVYLFPIPSGTYEMQWDCYCTPVPLVDNTTADLIPDNFTTSVFYYACYLALLSAQRKDDANDYLQRFDRAVIEQGAYAQPSRTPTYYPDEF